MPKTTRDEETESCDSRLAGLQHETSCALEKRFHVRDRQGGPGKFDEVALLQELRADAGPASLETVQQELDKLDRVRALGLPQDLFASTPRKILQAFRQRAAVAAPLLTLIRWFIGGVVLLRLFRISVGKCGLYIFQCQLHLIAIKLFRPLTKMSTLELLQ